MDYKTDPMNDLDAQKPSHLHSPGGGKRFVTKKLLIIIGCVVGVVALAIGAFFLLRGEDVSDAQDQQTAQQQEANPEEEIPASAPDAADPQTFKSTTLNIEFTHRKDWTVTESADKKQIKVTSPKIAYSTAEGESKTGVFTLEISLGATDGAQTAINNAKAVKDSFLIAYDAPTEAQRYYTNISYAGDTAFKFFIVTGSVVYKPGDSIAQTIHESDFLIAGGYGADAKSTLAFDDVAPTDIEQSAYEQAVAIVKSLKVF